jgi:cytoskeleton protein RodZ
MAKTAQSAPLGEYLRALREERAASLEEVAQATRVSVCQLEALEGENFAELPAPVFVKGFIRAYCHHLNVSSDEALARYRDFLGEPAATEGAAPGRRAPSWSANPIFISLLLLVVFGGGLLALNLAWKRQPRPSAARTLPAVAVDPASPAPARSATPAPATVPAPAPTVSPAPSASAPAVVPGTRGQSPVVAPAPTTAAAPPAVVPPPAPGPALAASSANTGGVQRLSAKAIEPTWIRVETDDGRVAEELLAAGATREWTSARRFVLTVGNAGGIELVLNGRAVPSLGPRGTVIRGLELPRPARPSGS